MGAAAGEYVVDELGGARGSAEAENVEAFLSPFADVCGAEDQLLTQLVYGGGSKQHDRVGDAEVMQEALDRTRASLPIVGFGIAGLLLVAGHDLATGCGRGAGEFWNEGYKQQASQA